ncbi:MAG: hypothetical protein ACTSYI_03900, partial [Promethearchaeota archaeon]
SYYGNSSFFEADAQEIFFGISIVGFGLPDGDWTMAVCPSEERISKYRKNILVFDVVTTLVLVLNEPKIILAIISAQKL